MDIYIKILEESGKIGWLLGKKQGEMPVQWEYFYLKTAALFPKQWILETCHNRVHQIIPTNDEMSILNLLKACAEYKAGNSDCSQIPLRMVYKNAEDYSRVISRFFDRTRSKNELSLRKFFNDYHTFKHSVLNKLPGKDCLEVKARELRLGDPNEFNTYKQIPPLRHITDVLKIGPDYTNESSCWFRPTGPIAIDFDEHKVYRRPSKVNELIKLVTNNLFSLLLGEAATGKTVLVRDMAYRLCDERNNSIYYYKYMDSDVTELAGNIDSINGIIILEDMHLDIPKLQQLYSMLKPDNDRHILSVLRGGLDKFQDLIHYDDLRKLPQLCLKPFEDADKIIDAFCSNTHTQDTVGVKREEIKKAAQQDLWLLSFALREGADSKGKGDPTDWLGQGVQTYLQSIENCGDQYESKYPLIILALSALYRNEICTHKSYLNKLGFLDHELRALCERGEIVTLKEGRNTYYGLHHSSLAKAYWEHGEHYKEPLPEFDDFIYDYAISGTPNCLRAILGLPPEIGKEIFDRILSNGNIDKIISAESSLRTFATCDNIKESISTDATLTKLLARRISVSNDFSGSSMCLLVFGKTLIEHLDFKRIATAMSHTRNLSGLGVVLCGLEEIKKDVSEFYNNLMLEPLAKTLNDSLEYFWAAKILLYIYSYDKVICQELFHKIDLAELGEKINHKFSLADCTSCLADIASINKIKAIELLQMTDKGRWMAAILNPGQFDSSPSIGDKANSIELLTRLDKQYAKDLISLLDDEQCANMLNISFRNSYFCADGICSFFEVIDNIDKKIANRIVSQFNAPLFAWTLSRRPEAEPMWMCFGKICEIDHEKIAEICNSLVTSLLVVSIVSTPEDHINNCIERIEAVDRNQANKLKAMISKYGNDERYRKLVIRSAQRELDANTSFM